MDCFVASAFARRRASADKSAPLRNRFAFVAGNDVEKHLRDLAACHARGLPEIPALSISRAQGGRAPDAPRGLVCNDSGRGAHEHTGHTGITRHSPRNGLRLITCSPRRPGFLPPSSARLSANLTPASGCRAHTSLPYARTRCRLKRSPASTAARPANVTIATRPSQWDRTACI
jgi:hypothetical protein